MHPLVIEPMNNCLSLGSHYKIPQSSTLWLCDPYSLCVCVCESKHFLTASTALGLVKIRPANLSGWKSWCFTNTISSYLIKQNLIRLQKQISTNSPSLKAHLETQIWKTEPGSKQLYVHMKPVPEIQAQYYSLKAIVMIIIILSLLYYYLDIRVCFIFTLSWLFQQQHFHYCSHLKPLIKEFLHSQYFIQQRP